MLPDFDGFQICKTIREKYTYPVIMLTAKDGELDTITGLTLGADDYVTKPFKPLALIARVKTQLRRYKKYNGFSEQADSGMKETIITTSNGLVMNISAMFVLLVTWYWHLHPLNLKYCRPYVKRKASQ